MPLNIAEGNGKRGPKDRARYFEIGRGSAFECAAIADVLSVGAFQFQPGPSHFRLRFPRAVSGRATNQ